MTPNNRQSTKNMVVIAFASVAFFAVLGSSRPMSLLLQTSPTATPTLLISTPTIVATAFPTGTQSRIIEDGPTNQDLLDHFEKVTSSMLTIATLVISVLGVLGGLGIYLGRSSLSELGDQVDKLKNSISEMETTQAKLSSEITRAENVSQSLLNRYRYLVECRDSQPSVRIRAIQQLSESNDIGAVSLITDMLADDEDAEVRAEAAFALGKLLVISGIGNDGIDGLITAIDDRSSEVKLQVIQALDNLICNRLNLPRKAYIKLEKIAASKSKNNITEACKQALKHKQQGIEGNLTNNI